MAKSDLGFFQAQGGPMSPPVVTLFEKYGSGARYVGPRVAETLGVAWMDQAVSSTDIESAKYPGASRGDEGSGLARLLGRFAPGATVLEDASIPLAQAQDAEMARENTRTVREAAAHGAVILGRNGALIIGNSPTALHVQLDAPAEVRIARAMHDEGIDEGLARRRQRNEDQVRVEMSERFYHWDPMAIDRYHLVINTGLLDLDTSVEVIVAAYRARAARAARAIA
jgi:cytidylate kinase